MSEIVNDLEQIRDMARWAYQNGYHPNGPTTPGPDRYTDPADVNADRIDGPRHDFGIGDHRSRQAFHAVAAPLREADRRLKVAAYIDGATHQPPPTNGEVRTIDQFDTLVAKLITRATLTTGADKRSAKQLELAHRQIDRAWRILSAALSRGRADGIASGESPCKICLIRPSAEKAGGRCNTCHSWLRRNEYERPRTIDEQENAGVRAAAARRRARGEGYGDESLSCVTWTEATGT